MTNLPEVVSTPPRGSYLDQDGVLVPVWRTWLELMHKRAGGTLGDPVIGERVVFQTTVGQADLASGGSVTLLKAKTGEQWKIREIMLSGDGTNFSGGSGDRLLTITDDTVSGSLVMAVPADTTADDAFGVHAATLGAEAQIQTTVKKFGAGSLEFSPTATVNPSTSFASYADTADWTIGAAPFTVAMWVRFKDLTDSAQVFASHYLNTGNQRAWHIRRNAADLELFLSDDGTSVAPAASITGAVTWVSGTQIHIAATRDTSNDVRLFFNGTQVGSTTAFTPSIHNSTEVFRLGKFRSVGFDDQPLFGFIDDFQLVIGEALWTADFTPPTSALTIPAAWTVIPAATLQTLAVSRWGETGTPFPSRPNHLTAAGAVGVNIVARYRGGTTDYTAGSCTIVLTAERVA